MLSNGVLASLGGAFGLMDILMEKRCLVRVRVGYRYRCWAAPPLVGLDTCTVYLLVLFLSYILKQTWIHFISITISNRAMRPDLMEVLFLDLMEVLFLLNKATH